MSNETSNKFSVVDIPEVPNSIDNAVKNLTSEPSIQTTAQALENSKYCISSEELRKMFVNLISSTMNSDYEKDAHPSFPEILKQMSVLDAHVLQDFKSTSTKPIVNYIIKNNSGTSLPYAQYVYLGSANGTIADYSTSISSLQRLGLLTIRFDEWFSDKRVYEPFKKTDLYISLDQTLKSTFPDSTANIEQGICSITPLGEKFIRVCLP